MASPIDSTAMNQQQQRVRPGLVCTLLLLLLALLQCTAVSVSAAPSASNDSTSPEDHYIIMIDAGSSGSRLHVHRYSWTEKSPLPIVHPSQNKKIKPGLSSFADMPDGAAAHIRELLDYAKEIVPLAERSATRVYLQATAGLRSVTQREALAIRSVVRDELSRSEFSFQPQWARIISGSQEGINGWIATNYLLGAFGNALLEREGEAPGTKGGELTLNTDAVGQSNGATHGVVEMGGSSMQITFSPAAPNKRMESKLQRITINGRSYPIYTHSFLQYGLQAAEKLFQSTNMDAIETNGNPCYPRGFRFTSTGNFDQCIGLMSKVIDKSRKCAYESCSFNGIFQPVIANEPFLAIENFFYTARFFGHVSDEPESEVQSESKQHAISKGNQLTQALKLKGAEYCNQEWATIQKTHKSVAQAELAYYCFAAAYQSAVLEHGFGFTPKSNVRAAHLVNGKAIDWELGATLIELLRDREGNQLDINEAAEERNTVEPPLDIYGDTPQSPYSLAGETSFANQITSVFYLLLASLLLGALSFCLYRRFCVSRSRPIGASGRSYSYERVMRDVLNKV